jgi:hypothetical protein
VILQIRATSTHILIPLRIGQAYYRPNITLTYTYWPIYLEPFCSAFAKLRKAAIIFMMLVRLSVLLSIRMSVGPHGATRLPLNVFS